MNKVWSGRLVIGTGWAYLDACLGANSTHAHLADQITLGLDGPVEVLSADGASSGLQSGFMVPGRTAHSIGPAGRLVRSVYVDAYRSGHYRSGPCGEIVSLPMACTERLRGAVTTEQIKDWLDGFVGGGLRAPIDGRLRTLIQNPDFPLTPARMASRAGVSPSRLRELSIAGFGVPPSKLAQWLQLQAAARALEGTSSLAGAAIAGGFCDQAHFTRRLKTWFGVSPKQGLAGLDISTAS